MRRISKKVRYIILFIVCLLPSYSFCQGVSSAIIDVPIAASVDYHYQNFIQIPFSNGPVNIINNSSVNVESADYILLNPGFTADVNDGCNSFFASINTSMGNSPVSLSPALNYIYVRVPNKPVLTETSLDNLNIKDKQLGVSYMDGLVRPLQDIKIQYTSNVNGKDLVLPHFLDYMGRESRQFLTYPSTNSNGNFNTSAPADVLNFHSNPSAGIAATQYSFADKLFERSPLDRIVEKGSFGADYQITSDHHTNRAIYSSNQISEIPIWNCTTNGASAMDNTSIIYYSESVLFKEENLDANSDIAHGYNGNSVTIYKDIKDRVVCKRFNVRTDQNETYDFTNGGLTPLAGTHKYYFTYYIYDQFGQLKYVIPPAASEYMNSHSNYSFNESDQLFGQYIFAYRYDSRGRVVEKKIPGQTGWQWIWYNKLDQTVATSSPNQHLTSTTEFTFSKYDLNGRIIMTGKSAYMLSRDDIQNMINGINNLWETRDNSNSTGYTSVSFPIQALEVYGINYFDSYDFSFDATLNSRTYQFYLPNHLSNQSKGLLTASKIKYTNAFLNSVNYYNDEGLLIQEHKENHLNGWDVYNHEYDFVGKEIYTERKHQVNSNPLLTIASRYTFDHENRLTDVFKKIGTDPEMHLLENEYNAIGKLILKKINVDASLTNGCLQQIDYRYDPKGWLTSINNSALINDGGITNTDDNDAFGEELFYANANDVNVDASASNSKVPLPQWNGNISAVSWKSKASELNPSAVAENSYLYRYDELNRLTAGYYCAGNPGLNNWYDKNFNWYDEKPRYDINGNISVLSRSYKGQLIDHLAYSYNGNVMTDITDAVVTPGPGFNDQVTFNDYLYDANGNLIKDANKLITSIEYNYLNLPERIHTSTQTLEYFYDKGGRKLCKKLDGAHPRDYIDGIEYQDGVLQFITTEEGRIRPKSSSSSNIGNYVYDYFLKDHLGNIRSVVSNENNVQQMAATMELQNATVENQLFYNLPITRENLPPGYPVDNSYTPNLKTSNVNSAEGKPIGPATVFHMNEGDQASVNVKYYFPQLPSAISNININTVVGQLASVFFLQPPNGISIAGADQTVRQQWADQSFQNNNSVISYLGNLINAPNNGSPFYPQAYLTYLFYDEDFNFISSLSGVQQTTLPNQLGSISVNNIVAPKNGYLYVYVSNEGPTEVYFDNLNIVHNTSALREKNDYFPYGLAIDELSTPPTNGVSQNYKYNGKEFQRELGYNVEDYGARHYDPVIGRWMQVDPLADESEQVDKSPYAAFWNNPIRNTDPDGRFPIETIWDFGNVIYDVGAAVVNHIKGDHKAARSNWADAGMDAGAMLIPYVPAGASKLVKAADVVQATDKANDVKKVVTKADDVVDAVKTNKTHGNKLDDKPAEGYTLRDKKSGDVKKYGETTRGEDKFGAGNQKRYTKKELKEKDVYYQKETSGTKKEMHKWQNEKIKEHKSNNNSHRPDLNKSDY